MVTPPPHAAGDTVVSVVIPAFNEAAFIGELLQRILALRIGGFALEIIVVDDGSDDETASIAEAFAGVRVVRQANQGKGAAVQRGVTEATGEFVLVQDADLEYDPADYGPLFLATRGEKRVAVYGSRPSGVVRDHGWRIPFVGRHPAQDVGPWGMNLVLSALFLLLFRRVISDPLTAYKLYPTKLLKTLDVESTGFEADHELTAKLIRSGVKIRSVPIAYDPRSVEEGKKIRPIDGLIAIRTIFRYRRRW